MPAPRVLISDALSPAAVQIFRDRGVEADFQPDLGKDRDKLAAAIGDYDGLAIRSATKVTAKILERAKNLKVIGGRASASTTSRSRRRPPGRDRHEHALRQLHHHRRARGRHDAGARPPDPQADASTQAGSGRRTASWASS
jgi:hypothetical protein